LSHLTDSLRGFLEANRYRHTEVGDNLYRLPFTGMNGGYDLFATASDERGHVMVFTYCPVYVPVSRRTLVADFINRVNYGLYLGCFEMDAGDGQIRARSSGPVGHEAVQAAILRSLFDSSFYLMDNWLPGILRVAFGSEDPRTAFDATIAAFSGKAIEPSAQDPPLDEMAADRGQPLTAIEEEVSKLLAEGDSEPDSKAPPS
jgi:hypothetical protein